GECGRHRKPAPFDSTPPDGRLRLDVRGAATRAWRPLSDRSGGSACGCRTNGGRLRTLRSLRHVELDLLVLLQVLVSLARDLAEVHEHVGTIGPGDEAEALLGAEPLHGASCHCNSLLPWPDRTCVLSVGRRLDRRPRELLVANCAPNPRNYFTRPAPRSLAARRDWADPTATCRRARQMRAP